MAYDNKDFNNQDLAKVYEGTQDGLIPAGLATEANQIIGNNTLDSISKKVSLATKQDDQTALLSELTNRGQNINLTFQSYSETSLDLLTSAINAYSISNPLLWQYSINSYINPTNNHYEAIVVYSNL